MRHHIPLALALSLWASLAQAQLLNPNGVASVNGQSGTVSLTIPTPSASIPNGHTTNGATGTSTQYVPSDAAPKLDIQTANTTIAADCTWSVSFGQTFASSTPVVHASVMIASPTQPMPCIIGTRSATAATGKCFPAQTTTLNLSIITAGINLNPFSSTCTAGTPVMIVGREPSQ